MVHRRLDRHLHGVLRERSPYTGSIFALQIMNKIRRSSDPSPGEEGLRSHGRGG